MWLAGIALLAAVAVAMAAFAIPFAAFPDCQAACATKDHRQRLEVQAQHVAGPALHLRVAEARATGSSPDAVEGRVEVRTLFGIPAGDVLTGARTSENRRSTTKEAGIWGAFAAIEAVLVALAGYRLYSTA